MLVEQNRVEGSNSKLLLLLLDAYHSLDKHFIYYFGHKTQIKSIIYHFIYQINHLQFIENIVFSRQTR